MIHGVDTNPDNFVLAGELAPDEASIAPPSATAAASALAASDGRRADDNFRDLLSFSADGPVDLAAALAGGGLLSLVRVEVGSGRFVGKARVVVRGGSHAISQAVCAALLAQLSPELRPPVSRASSPSSGSVCRRG